MPAVTPSERAPQGRLPDFFIVGHAKCGTSALYQMLSGHPQIHMPVKEPWFFTPEKRARGGRGGSDGHSGTLEGYMALFTGAGPGQRVGEATPSYLSSSTAAREIAALRPDARIIAILREPVSFLRSYHLQAVQNHNEPEHDLRKAIALDESRLQADEGPRHGRAYGRVVQYVEQLRRYHAVFPREQVLVLIYEDFRDDNEATVRQVLRFLDVDDAGPIAATEANPSVRVRSRRLDELVRSVYMGSNPASRAVRAAIKLVAPRRLRHDALHLFRRRVLYGAPRPQADDLTVELRRRFKGEVVALSEYLNRDLVTFWGYDDVD